MKRVNVIEHTTEGIKRVSVSALFRSLLFFTFSFNDSSRSIPIVETTRSLKCVDTYERAPHSPPHSKGWYENPNLNDKAIKKSFAFYKAKDVHTLYFFAKLFELSL